MYDDPTLGRRIGEAPGEDPTQGRRFGTGPGEDPTQELGSDRVRAKTPRRLADVERRSPAAGDVESPRSA
jgi:hypothetical protein